ncbi:class I SAM-dependent methyltransferase [Spirulina sp. 06S082]|uniref:class I SAM-dependent methyltransferase n=1 Tax=Spirulina sp. 06S082 TaxID=3110248 RepID=UPI002B1F7018|nr:class I SAM-dependent methyltransferase [Spirulina sp. 06S082]MEA5472198.1 class I SAM-dependent methyltransferase [Spirulina sp. 06S082]
MTARSTSANCEYTVWQDPELAKTFLEGIRGAIPLAAEQIDMILRIVAMTQPQVESFLDLGCGDGILGRSLYQSYPDSRGIFLDFSATMLTTAKANFAGISENFRFVAEDFGAEYWRDRLIPEMSALNLTHFDVIVSGFAIHHQSDDQKRAIYQDIFSLLKPGGLFLNLEHISSRSQWEEQCFNELFIDSLYRFHQAKGSQNTKEEIAHKFYHRDDKNANILAPMETQCQWLTEIGFIDVDCFLKIFEIALFGGLKPT